MLLILKNKNGSRVRLMLKIFNNIQIFYNCLNNQEPKIKRIMVQNLIIISNKSNDHIKKTMGIFIDYN